jgi:hypothetical protein
VKHANELVLMAKEVMVLQGMLERLAEVVRRYGIERNVEETKVMKIARQPLSPPPPPASTDYGNSGVREQENFHQQMGIKDYEEISEMLHVENSFVRCCKLDASENTSELPGRF